MTSALDEVGGQSHVPTAFTPGKDQVLIAQEGGRAPGPVWIGAENLNPTGNRSPDRPANSESLYQLRYDRGYRTCLLRIGPTGLRRRK
jgi:hypothetical protein